MRAVRAAIGIILMLGFLGCGSSKLPVMPDLIGKKLDVALSDVKRAGFTQDVEVLGGGVLGVVEQANWTVCEQEPAAGQAIEAKPRVKVARQCEGATPTPKPTKAATTPAATTAKSSPPASPAPSTQGARTASATAPTPSTQSTSAAAAPSSSSVQPPMTVADSPDFAALAALTDQCSATQADFASKYAGRAVQFDGSVGALGPHGSAKTRYDILINLGDDGLGTKGPNFQFRDVNLSYDIHLTGSYPETMKVGDNLRVTATVDRFEPKSCLFLLKPVSTEYR